MTETTLPIRVQLRRIKGWRLPPNTLKVDRSTRWGNPHRVVDGRTAAEAVAMFEQDLAADSALVGAATQALRGKNLACWCPLPAPGETDHCHAAVWLRIVNVPLVYEGISDAA